MKMKSSQLKVGTIISYVSMILSNIISIIYTPIMLRLLGQTEYGLMSISNSVIGYLGLLNFGLGSAVVRYTAKYKALEDKEGEYNLNGMFVIVYTILAILVLVSGWIVYLNIDKMFMQSMTVAEINKIKLLLIIMIINLAISFPFSIFASIISSYERFTFQKTLELMKTITSPFIMIPFLFMGYKSVTITLINVILNIIYILVNVYYCFKVLKIKIKFKKIEFNLIKEIALFSFFLLISSIVDQIYWSTDQLILGSKIGSKEVAIYSVGSTFASIFISLTSVVGGMMLPRFTKLTAVNGNEKLISDEFIKISRIQFMISTYIFGGFLFLGRDFIQIWAGDVYGKSFYVAVIIMGGILCGITQNAGIFVLQAKNLHKYRAIPQLVIATSNILLTLKLVDKYGCIGAAIASSICFFFGNFTIMSIIYYKKVKLDILELWKQLIKFIPTFVMISIVIYIVNKFECPINYMSVITRGMIYTIIHMIFIFKRNMNEYEKKLINDCINKLKNVFISNKRVEGV